MSRLGETLELVRVDSTEKGKGVFADKPIAAGTVITDVRGEHVTFGDTTTMGERESFCVQIGRMDYILPDPPFYLINHSCEPNCGINADMKLIALRDIAPDEEITWDYSTTMLERSWVMECKCGSENCRGVVRDFDLLPEELQARYIVAGIVQPYILEYLSGKNGTTPNDPSRENPTQP